MTKKIWSLVIITVSVSLIIFLGIRYFALSNFPTKPKITRPYPVQYRYYQIIDRSTGKTLTYVSSAPVNIGDEYITENNKRYVVIKVHGNKAYAKFVGMAK